MEFVLVAFLGEKKAKQLPTQPGGWEVGKCSVDSLPTFSPCVWILAIWRLQQPLQNNYWSKIKNMNEGYSIIWN